MSFRVKIGRISKSPRMFYVASKENAALISSSLAVSRSTIGVWKGFGFMLSLEGKVV
jgi:hypothetical protein